MATIDDIREGYAELFDALREVYFPAGAALRFLIINDETNDFETIYDLAKGWYFEYSRYRSGSPVFRGDSDVFKLSIAVGRDAVLVETINRARYVEAVGEIYVIRPADTLAPQGEEPVWKLYCEQHSSMNQFSAGM